MKFYLRDIKPEITAAWKHWFEKCEDVEISTGDIFAKDGPKADAIVSPANSFGFMDGGIDLIYSLHFGWELQKTLRDELNQWHDGELPVGEAIIVPTKNEEIPWCISAPTMRVPTFVGGTANAYLAFRAVIRAVKEWNAGQGDNDGYQNEIKSILCPGLGTAVGRMTPEQCAKQMFYAYTICHKGEKQKIIELADAWNLHTALTKDSGNPFTMTRDE